MAGSGLFNRTVKVAKIGFAARRLKKSGTDDDRLKARRALASLFEDARGVTMKLGQFLAEGQDDPLARLVGGIEARPLSDMMPVLEQELGRPASDVFESIEESAAAASLGQFIKPVSRTAVRSPSRSNIPPLKTPSMPR